MSALLAASSPVSASLWVLGQSLPAVTTDMLVVMGIVLLALVLFISEVLPIDVTALGLMVIVMLLEPWTHVGPSDGISGFASTATITVLAMFILSEGVRRTGILTRIGNAIVRRAKGNFLKQYTAVIGLSGTTAGFINNTPVVAMMIPMVMGIARKTRSSPSKLLMPLSFASMMGGMLTLIGTSTNILASDVSARLLDRPFSMFEFTSLGALVLVSGAFYLVVAGRHLLPERIKPEEDLTEEFALSGYLTEVVVTENSPLVGSTVQQGLARLNVDVDIVQMIRDREAFPAPITIKQFRPGDILMLRARRDVLLNLMKSQRLEPIVKTKITADDFDLREQGEKLVELVLLSDNPLIGETLRSVSFAQRYDALVLAIRRQGATIQERIDGMPLKGGDTLLVQASERSLRRFNGNRTFVVVQDVDDAEVRRDKIPLALGIVAAVVGLAALNVMPIVVSSLLGVVAMIITGCLRPTELYPAVDWSVIVLLAGVIPLGMALERSGGAAYLASLTAGASETLPAFLLLLLFYLFTTLITNVISNNASVVLMIPVAVEAAALTGSDPFSFVLAVTFAASTAMLTPVGYQTNLMVYGPGGYRFTDFFRVGAPLQLLLAFVTCGGIYLLWGV
jgi:di/tricarboxylate transporter